MRVIYSFIFLLLFSSLSFAALVEQPLEYRQADTVLEGYLVYDDAAKEKRPGALVVHEWYGLGEHAKNSARKLAEDGFVALAVDMYGKGIRPDNNEDAAKHAGIYKNDRLLMRERIKAGLDTLKENPLVDQEKIVALGYCFGGTSVLELARSGADVRGVVSFHGGLNTPAVEDAKNIKAKVLVLHGKDDPFVPPQEVESFEEEMRSANVDYRVVSYPGAVHSFKNPDAGTDNAKGVAYNAQADAQSWEEMKNFFQEILQ